MYHGLFSARFRQFSLMGFLFVALFFSFLMGASANDRCPTSKDHSLSAVRYQMFTAYQTAYDGYQAPCEIKCFNRTTCVESCQGKKGLESLKTQFTKLLEKKGLKNCSSYSQVCKEQCKDQGKSCTQACST